MGASAEFITGTVFAAVMVLIGLGAIWIVRWQTYFLIHHQERDLEGAPRLPESIVAEGDSVELAAAGQPFECCFREPGRTILASQHTLTGQLSCPSGIRTPSQDPGTPIPRGASFVAAKAASVKQTTEA